MFGYSLLQHQIWQIDPKRNATRQVRCCTRRDEQMSSRTTLPLSETGDFEGENCSHAMSKQRIRIVQSVREFPDQHARQSHEINSWLLAESSRMARQYN